MLHVTISLLSHRNMKNIPYIYASHAFYIYWQLRRDSKRNVFILATSVLWFFNTDGIERLALQKNYVTSGCEHWGFILQLMLASFIQCTHMNHQESNLTLLTVWSKHIPYYSHDSLLLKDISPIMMRLVNDKTTSSIGAILYQFWITVPMCLVYLGTSFYLLYQSRYFVFFN